MGRQSGYYICTLHDGNRTVCYYDANDNDIAIVGNEEYHDVADQLLFMAHEPVNLDIPLEQMEAVCP